MPTTNNSITQHFYSYTIYSTAKATLSALVHNGRLLAYILEDPIRQVKIPKITAIPSGVYELSKRYAGKHFIRYRQKFPEWHDYTIEVSNVPNFQWIMIHIGNSTKDTDGCLLVGSSYKIDKSGEIVVWPSTLAYKKVYLTIKKYLDAKEKVVLHHRIINYSDYLKQQYND